MMLHALSLTPAQDGSTFWEIIRDIPTDPASVFIYLLLAAGVGWVVWGSRSGGNRT